MSDDEGFKSRIGGEVMAWLKDGIVNAGVARRILERYAIPVPADLDQHGRRRGGGIIAGLGATLMGLGILLFVASNWSGMDRPIRLAVLLLAMFAVQALRDRVEARGMRRTAAALVALGTVIYLAAVFLVGQTYHLAVNDPILGLLGAIGALAVAFTATSRPAFVIGMLALITAYAMQLDRWSARDDLPFMVIAALTWGMAAVAGSVNMTRARATEPFAPWLLLMGSGAVTVVLAIMSFSGTWQSMRFAGYRSTPSDEFHATIVLATVLFLALLGQAARNSRLPFREALVFVTAAIVTVAVPSGLVLLHPFGEAPLYSVAMNLLILGIVIAAIWYGIRTAQERFINAGLALFAIVAICRYVDVAFLLFDRSVVFIGAGLVLLGLGWALERGRRTLMAHAEAGGVA